MKLPWKEGRPELPTNYSTSLRRLKSQVARLEKEPEVLREYATPGDVKVLYGYGMVWYGNFI